MRRKILPYFILAFNLNQFACQSTLQETASQAVASDPFAHIDDLEARRILAGACQFAGGLDQWKNRKAISFAKQTVLYDSTEQVESTLSQRIKLQNKPQTKVDIKWNANGISHQISYEGAKATKIENGQNQTPSDPTGLNNAILSARYVMSIPFELLKTGYKLSYLGLDTLSGGQIVHVLKARYETTENDGETDTWWHYYHQTTFQQLGYKVQHADHFSLVENLAFVKNGGFMWPVRRKSYRVNERGEKLFLRADYTYGAYEVE